MSAVSCCLSAFCFLVFAVISWGVLHRCSHLLAGANTLCVVCDNKIENGGGPAPDGNQGCNMACSGNSAETCGGNLRLNLYQYA